MLLIQFISCVKLRGLLNHSPPVALIVASVNAVICLQHHFKCLRTFVLIHIYFASMGARLQPVCRHLRNRLLAHFLVSVLRWTLLRRYRISFRGLTLCNRRHVHWVGLLLWLAAVCAWASCACILMLGWLLERLGECLSLVHLDFNRVLFVIGIIIKFLLIWISKFNFVLLLSALWLRPEADKFLADHFDSGVEVHIGTDPWQLMVAA